MHADYSDLMILIRKSAIACAFVVVIADVVFMVFHIQFLQYIIF